MSDKNTINYDDILSNMNLYVENGQLRIIKGPVVNNSEPKEIRLSDNYNHTMNDVSEQEKRENEKQQLRQKNIQENRVRMLRNSRTSKMILRNNYPDQMLQDYPERTTTIFPIKK